MKFHWSKELEYPPTKPERRFYGIQIGTYIIGFLRFRGGASIIMAEVWDD